MDRLVWENASKQHEQEFGNFNQFPPNWREVTEKEFTRAFLMYAPIAIEYRQMMRAMDNTAQGYVAARLFFMADKTGVALSEKNDKLKFYRFGCHHKWQPATEAQLRERKHWPLAQTEHAAYCPDCNSFRITDSSD